MFIFPASITQTIHDPAKLNLPMNISSFQSLPTIFEVGGVSIPAVGFGTFQGDNGNSKVKDVVLTALRNGYRHIDTAAAYGNEKEVGETIKESGLPRSEIFVTTKLAQTWHDPEDVEEALDRSLRDLQLDYENIHLTGHQPLGGKPVAAVNPNANRPGPLSDPNIAEIASAYGKSPAQVLLSWAVQRGTSVVPKTVNAHRMIKNRDLFRLKDEHMEEINSLAEKKGALRFLDPRDHIGFDIFREDVDEPVEGTKKGFFSSFEEEGRKHQHYF
ncbi:hypothetical protein G7Y89_g6872 [Cudoniella acicularis]|uniref:NADP-dependent oxidoreductase domain-containing protein n=1 Tax=Cudoniella acicularis TaxID=354080 RepID=A0A8H4W218_9HELO|nr:hypothetical protein G7Y89_g6872 [Cudoniella acicularis]